ncbi:lipoprotein [Asanoa siamensis]|uniref:Lipoprotein n=2 Tax=Asanoa siamensis TaxID=926357 RepID=A0ABQ4D4T8_9ACTN|nr:lipoprotein [Asanoa siamensis]
MLAVGLALITIAALLMAVDHARRTPTGQPVTDSSAPSPVPSSIQSFQALTPLPTEAPSPPHEGQGVFSTTKTDGRYLGRGATLLRFHVAVEKGIGLRLADFTKTVDTVLGDPRSWIADGELKLRRVSEDEPADFTVYLASAATSERMCAEGGLDTDGYTSCQLGGQVIINADRWVSAVPEFEAPLAEYRAYAINHEVGHQLGHGHAACPAPGAAAPVMQQQTLGMQGCLPYGWPYLDGRLHTGPDIP